MLVRELTVLLFKVSERCFVIFRLKELDADRVRVTLVDACVRFTSTHLLTILLGLRLGLLQFLDKRLIRLH